MATFRKFEDIEAWKRARELSKRIYSFSRRDSFSVDFKFRNQIRGASGSIMDNIAEGFDRGGTKEFQKFLRYAKGSSAEVQSQLYRALDQGYISQDEFDELYINADKINKMIKGLLKYLQQTSQRGTNY